MSNFVVGRNAVKNLLVQEKKIFRILLAKNVIRDQKIQEILYMANVQRISVDSVDSREIEKIYKDDNHQGILAYLPNYQYAEIEDILLYAEELGEMPFVLILDELEDPYNFGSIIRTAVGAGVHGIVIANKNQVDITPAVMKVSMGLAEEIKIAKVSNLVQIVEKLKKKGVWVIGTHQDAPKSYLEQEYDFPLALVIGNETRGMARLLKEKCDYFINIPLKNKGIDSLNASVAGAVIMFNIIAKRQGS